MKRSNGMKSIALIAGLLGLLCIAGNSFAAKPPPQSPVDLSTATVEQLVALPGIGQAKAQAIVEYRAQNGIAVKEDLLNVKGIGQALLAKISEHITISNGQKKTSGMAEKVVR
ncbi:MAG TPA: helix-hairpin-helix domain-containing protein [bacterium]|jgi:competence protein ComEA|nr:MAG: ComE operon protein 1 [bacterium ADurb.Bin270]HPW46039.1 helix-hairpin-helix domain-containing protein [bacterium]HQC50739.1 helix-hairpin-helix domain-containing protein [bacterium]HQG13325.1 helix-hairpin-helix domain-containing protein [bacterium]HQH80295.1 helix-hairpin-helix domain-containing protein [bacterium]